MRSGTERTRNNGTRRSCASLRNLLLLMLVTVTGIILTSSDMPNISLSAMQTKMKNELDIDGSVSKNVDVSESPTTSRTIKQISIIGERNSGTRWTFDHLSECFNHSLVVKKTFTRYKHWFQEPVYDRYPHNTLVIAQFRNPYDWLKGMQKKPHHMTEHVQYRDDKYFKEFLTIPWTMERIGNDRWPNQTKPCQQHFEWKDIVSCQLEPIPLEEFIRLHGNHTYSNHQPFYEMKNDGSGEPYANIMEMRTDKILNFLTVKDYEGVADEWIIQYENLVNNGTQSFIDAISKVTGVEAKCKPYPAQNRKKRKMDPKLADFIRSTLDWTVEEMIGYFPHKR